MIFIDFSSFYGVWDWEREVRGYIDQVSTELPHYIHVPSEPLPDWMVQYAQSHERFKETISVLLKDEKTDLTELQPAIRTLYQSKKTLEEVAKKVNYSGIFGQTVAPNKTIAGSSGLLTAVTSRHRKVPSETCLREWELNMGLLFSAYQRIEDPELKKTVRFLMINYLAKSALLNWNPPYPSALTSDEMRTEYAEMIQLGQFAVDGAYHRDWIANDNRWLNAKCRIQEQIPHEPLDQQFLTETLEIQKLFNVSFKVAPELTETEKVVDFLIQHYHAETQTFPVLIDVTSQLMPEDSSHYLERRELIKHQIESIIERAAAKIGGNRDEIIENIQKNLVIVARAKVQDHLSVVILPSFFKDLTEAKGKVNEWTRFAGTGLGSIMFRKNLAEIYDNPFELMQALGDDARLVNYTVKGPILPKELPFPSPVSFLSTQNFLSFVEHTTQEMGAAQVILASATIKMIDTLLHRIPEDRWQNPVTAEITQIIALRLSHHLANALLFKDDFRKFCQAIDRTHAELGALLALYAPFNFQEFKENYAEFLKPILPESLTLQTVGIGKSAMNIFAGINSLILNKNPDAIRVCGQYSYFEEPLLVGNKESLESVLANETIEKIDLYVAEFNHNSDSNPNHTHYTQGTVIEDIRRIFIEKPQTAQLTVAIDGTIDFVQSEDLANLFQEFEKEIQEGKLNVVVFRSGQKFDMLGLDNYFGAPFYVVNNHDPKWEMFKTLATDPVFQTDDLSIQFFSWITQSDPAIVDRYKERIFENAKSVLSLVPPRLLPKGEKHEVCISTVDERAKTPFIELKISLGSKKLNEEYEIATWTKWQIYELFKQEGKMFYRRDSFGFFHPNVCLIKDKMRISLGLDPDENRLYLQFFQDLAEKLDDMQIY